MRILLFLGLVLVVLWLPVWVLALYCLWYAYLYFAWDVILLASFVDAYFGSTLLPYYTLVATTLVIAVEWIRPSLALKVY